MLAGSGGGWIARRLGVPEITGNIVAGALVGTTMLSGMDVPRLLQPISTFAISLIAVTAGGHLSYRRVHNAMRRILFVAVFESGVAVLAVFTVMMFFDASWEMALLLGCLAAGTSPGTTVALIRENRAKGPFVKTLLASVSVDSSLCILLFAFAHNLLAHANILGSVRHGVVAGAMQIGWQLGGALTLAVLLGLITSRLLESSRFNDFSTMAVAILVASGISLYFDFSPLLTCLLYGAYMGNTSPENERKLNSLSPVEGLLYTSFFTLAGVSIHIALLPTMGALCALYILARGAGKSLGAFAGAFVAGASQRIRSSIPLAFLPQAGVAVGLIVILQGDSRIDPEFSSAIGTLVLAAVTINEIVGPFATRYALRRSGEAGLDRPRLVEFLQEEFILTDLEADDKWDALTKMTDFYARTHRVKQRQRDAVYASVLERENEGSTAIGFQAAIPHGKIDSGDEIQGVLAICPNGVEFDAPDGLPVKLIVLIVTPREHEQRHLDVLASLSSMISNENVRTRLMAALDANDAWEVIESEQSRPYNYFLEA